MKVSKMLKLVQGMSFKTIGPFLVAELNEETFSKINESKHGIEKVKLGQKTQSHTHDFPSFYKSFKLDVTCREEKYSLPEKALTLVLPGIHHSWIPQGKDEGAVGSVDSRHNKQVLVDCN